MVTNALNIASELAVRSNIELVVCGGSARSESYELVGPLAELTLSNINLDVAVIGVDGVHPSAGFTTHHEVEAHTNRALVRAAERVIVVADSSKIGERGFARIGDIAIASDIVTDSQCRAAGRGRAAPARAARCTSSTCPDRRASARRSGPRRAAGSRSPWAATMSSASRQMSSERQGRRGVRVDHQRLPDELRTALGRRPGR